MKENAEAKKIVQEERNARYAKEGEVSILRKTVEKVTLFAVRLRLCAHYLRRRKIIWQKWLASKPRGSQLRPDRRSYARR